MITGLSHESKFSFVNNTWWGNLKSKTQSLNTQHHYLQCTSRVPVQDHDVPATKSQPKVWSLKFSWPQTSKIGLYGKQESRRKTHFAWFADPLKRHKNLFVFLSQISFIHWHNTLFQFLHWNLRSSCKQTNNTKITQKLYFVKSRNGWK